MNGNSLHPDDAKLVHFVNGGDHGEAKFCMTVKLIIKTTDGGYYEKFTSSVMSNAGKIMVLY